MAATFIGGKVLSSGKLCDGSDRWYIQFTQLGKNRKSHLRRSSSFKTEGAARSAMETFRSASDWQMLAFGNEKQMLLTG